MKQFFKVIALSVIGFTLFGQLAYGQTLNSLTVGDKFPTIEINNIMNYPLGKLNTSQLKGKLTLIDFWGTTCSSCIEALPKIDSLQKKFKNKVQVLTVTNYDRAQQVKEVWARFQRKALLNMELPVVLNDSKLKLLFPHQLVSHVVWIDGSGIVKAITGTEYITAENIQAVLDGKTINWPVKKDVFGFDYDKPLLGFGNKGVAPIPLYYSSFTGAIDGIDARNNKIENPLQKTISMNFYNATLLNFCDGALKGIGVGYTPNEKNTILEVSDRSRYFKGSEYYTSWAAKNTYCYSITLPLNTPNEKIRTIMSADLSRWLDLWV